MGGPTSQQWDVHFKYRNHRFALWHLHLKESQRPSDWRRLLTMILERIGKFNNQWVVVWLRTRDIHAHQTIVPRLFGGSQDRLQLKKKGMSLSPNGWHICTITTFLLEMAICIFFWAYSTKTRKITFNDQWNTVLVLTMGGCMKSGCHALDGPG